jgi:hypothetical protein
LEPRDRFGPWDASPARFSFFSRLEFLSPGRQMGQRHHALSMNSVQQTTFVMVDA